MAYKFTFDLSQISQTFFRDIARFSERKGIHRKIGQSAREIVKKFKIHELTGLPISDAFTVIEDFIDSSVKNITNREKFLKTKKRALLLPHCSRKYMDSRCKAKFNTKTSSYECMHCSPDCLVNQATKLAKKKGYKVYVLPGGSCVKNILTMHDGVVGVACTEEIKLANSMLEPIGYPSQAVPLVKNGCSGTKFSMETLAQTL
ncbi:MAG: DUF116 domain-containing protein [Candidatus Aenigmarchaeota archaeon]|nr:DUF116 domain-containing protein [Candidatus Aenigmarchaeota archaeon]